MRAAGGDPKCCRADPLPYQRPYELACTVDLLFLRLLTLRVAVCGMNPCPLAPVVRAHVLPGLPAAPLALLPTCPRLLLSGVPLSPHPATHCLHRGCLHAPDAHTGISAGRLQHRATGWGVPERP